MSPVATDATKQEQEILLKVQESNEQVPWHDEVIEETPEYESGVLDYLDEQS